MSNRPIEELPSDLAALLAAERRAPAPPVARRARILASLQPILSGASDPMSTPPGPGTAAIASKLLLVASLTSAVSFGGALALSRRPSGEAPAPPPPVASVAPAPAPPPEAPVAAPSFQIAPSAAAWAHPPRRRRPIAVAVPHAQAVEIDLASLRAEAATLERARVALADGDAPTALKTLAHAARHFPRGALIEEREALTIRALAAAGQRAAARDRAAAFTRDHPASIQAAAIAAALAAEIR